MEGETISREVGCGFRSFFLDFKVVMISAAWGSKGKIVDVLLAVWGPVLLFFHDPGCLFAWRSRPPDISRPDWTGNPSWLAALDSHYYFRIRRANILE